MSSKAADSTEGEVWRPIPDYLGWYEASSIGRVRRVRSGMGARVGRVLRQRTAKKYRYVDLYRTCRKTSRAVHVLVASAFHGRRPAGKEVNHKDLDKLNNRADNLEWMTHAANMRHATSQGIHGGRPMPGERNGRAKLTDEAVREILLLKGVLGTRKIAARFGVSRSAVRFIHQGKTWRHLT